MQFVKSFLQQLLSNQQVQDHRKSRLGGLQKPSNAVRSRHYMKQKTTLQPQLGYSRLSLWLGKSLPVLLLSHTMYYMSRHKLRNFLLQRLAFLQTLLMHKIFRQEKCLWSTNLTPRCSCMQHNCMYNFIYSSLLGNEFIYR